MNKFQRLAGATKHMALCKALGGEELHSEMDAVFAATKEFNNEGFDAIFVSSHVRYLLCDLRVKPDPSKLIHMRDWADRFETFWLSQSDKRWNDFLSTMKEIVDLLKLDEATDEYTNALMLWKLTNGGEQ